MTVYEPGGECLTRIQHDQREFQKRLQEKVNPSPATAARNLTQGNVPAADTLRPEAVKPAQAGEKPAASYGSLHSQYLDISV